MSTPCQQAALVLLNRVQDCIGQLGESVHARPVVTTCWEIAVSFSLQSPLPFVAMA